MGKIRYTGPKVEYNLEKQHKKGKLHAIERIRRLLDKESFYEIFPNINHSCTSYGLEGKTIPYDGVITGFGKIDGRMIAIYAQDFTVMGGTLGKKHGEKIAYLTKKAIEFRIPIIGINDSGGARIQEGVNALSGYGEVFMQNVNASGYIPQISIIAGPCAGGAVYSPGITDFIFAIDDISMLFITGPKVVKTSMGIDITEQDLGGSRVHAQVSGVVHFRSKSEEECFIKLKELLKAIPHFYTDIPEKRKFSYNNKKCREILRMLPERDNQGYEIRNIISCILDDDKFLEIHEEFAMNIVVGFGRIEGATIGIIANQPSFMAGVLDSAASEKAARFIRYCDAFEIPLLTLVDIPGFLPGPDEEKKGIIRNGAKLIYAYAEATVPKITLIIRKAFGGAYIAMCSRHLEADFVYAWPTAQIAVMGAEGAVSILFGKDIEYNGVNKENLIKEYTREYMNPKEAERQGYITSIIEPENTREYIARGFEILTYKRRENPVKKKHGNIPL